MKNKINNLQKNFYFQNLVDEDKTGLNNSHSLFNTRANFVFKIFFLVFLIILLKLFYLGLNKSNEINFEDSIIDKDYNQRKDIYDRANLLIAKNIDIYDLVLKVDKTNNLPELLIKLKSQFPSLNINEIQRESVDKKRLVLKKKLDHIEYKKAIMLGEPAIELSRRQVRIYPQRNLFSHVLGQTDEDNKGVSGIENYFNNQILNNKFSQSSFQISLDTLVQSQIRDSLEKAIEDYSAKGAASLLMNVNSGEILSLVSLPDFDINRRTLVNDEKYLNKITLGVYELGSVFKTFTIANALELKLIDENTLFKNLEKQVYNCGTSQPIDEHDKNLKRDLTTSEILVKSSNIGTIKIIEKIGTKKERVISEETSKKMVKMLRKVVDKDDPMQGTAKKADIGGYGVIGKTGTAIKASKTSKGYSKEVMTVFVSAYPEEKPEYLLLVMIDEPKVIPSKGLYRSDSGWNAVPTAGTIIKRIGPILASKNYNIAFNAK